MVNNPRYVLLIFQLEFQKKRLYDNSSVPSNSFGIFRSVVSTPIIRVAACCYVVQSLNYFNPSSPKIHIQILQTDLHTFPLRLVERI